MIQTAKRIAFFIRICYQQVQNLSSKFWLKFIYNSIYYANRYVTVLLTIYANLVSKTLTFLHKFI